MCRLLPRLAGALLSALLLVAATLPARAVLVYDTSAQLELVGSRSLTNGLYATGNNPPTTLTVAWEIDFGATMVGMWSYRYTMTYFGGATSISHVILDLSDDCVAAANCLVNTVYAAQSNGQILTLGSFGLSTGNPNMGGTIVGVKFDETNGGSPFTISFSSPRPPVYGDIYLKAGQWQAQNLGIDDHLISSNIMDFIARPNGAELIAEPTGLALLATAVAAIGLRRRRTGALPAPAV